MIRTLLAALLLALPLAGALAQQTSPLGAGPAPAAERSLLAGRGAPPTTASRGFLSDSYAWMLAQQERINRELAGAVRAIKSADPMRATLLLAFLSFLYGVLHAAGPGHGKAVISSYVLANEQTVRRGIMLSFLAALFQALSAIVIVGVLAILLKATSITIRATEAWIETLSWGLVAVIGAWLLWRQIKAIHTARALSAPAHEPAHGAHHRHAHGHHVHGPGCTHDHDHGHDHHHHHEAPARHVDADVHDHADCCGHAHIPAPSELQGPWSWRRALAIALAVGIRPCTGAILIMIFALSQGLLWAGVFATFAMALGTAITISALAALAVGSRELAARLGGAGSGWVTGVNRAAGLLGAALVFALGSIFFLGSLSANSPL